MTLDLGAKEDYETSIWPCFDATCCLDWHCLGLQSGKCHGNYTYNYNLNYNLNNEINFFAPLQSHMSSPQLENFLQELDLEYKEEYNNIGG